MTAAVGLVVEEEVMGGGEQEGGGGGCGGQGGISETTQWIKELLERPRSVSFVDVRESILPEEMKRRRCLPATMSGRC